MFKNLLKVGMSGFVGGAAYAIGTAVVNGWLLPNSEVIIKKIKGKHSKIGF